MGRRTDDNETCNVALVFIVPTSGVGGEWPTPVRFSLKQYTRRYVMKYVEACRDIGQGARIVWIKE